MVKRSRVHRIVNWRSPIGSPIYNVPDEILLTIFSVNTISSGEQLTMNEYALPVAPITTIRLSSQVCRHWRELILGCPALWRATTLNLNELSLSRSDNWAKEVLSRTKKALIAVRVVFKEDRSPQAMISFFFKVLDEEWPRIQHLEASVDTRAGDYDDDRWLSIFRPTENLRSISLHFPMDATPKPFLSTTSVLFSDHAPSLRSISIRHMPFQLSAVPWLSQLTELRLAGQFAPGSILASLSATPSLETFEILYPRDMVPPNNSNAHLNWSKVNLPKLKCLITRGPLEACLMLLDQIIAPPECGLDFGSHTYSAEESLSPAVGALARYCEGYFKTYNPPLIELTLCPSQFGFHTLRQSDIPPFDIRIENLNGFPSMSCLFKQFVNCRFSGASRFRFDAENGITFLLTDPHFSKFISLLSSVRRLETLAKSLVYLSQIPTQSDVAFFPSLEWVRVARGRGIYPESVPQMIDFLLWLKSSGGSIQSIDIGVQTGLEDRGVDLSPLEQFSGLNVQWSSISDREEYICGSGTPERLNFLGDPMLLENRYEPPPIPSFPASRYVFADSMFHPSFASSTSTPAFAYSTAPPPFAYSAFPREPLRLLSRSRDEQPRRRRRRS
ncbi:hypothetical protein M413DRAFT_445235 [Hebeloma cylindrosporum]|uniref:F-box domain-containing protein n=1 Tax=Hebeloma cylindrosporum TaxID=76867 RepID=A0A0C3CEK7_HEBCY|nr:hypothetical protein M413DRAFT_445235 [Hebeloma cylindrosporum h7]